eukprot:jgi/Picsp_1/5967/NSC_03322-R1_prc-barrel domain protein
MVVQSTSNLYAGISQSGCLPCQRRIFCSLNQRNIIIRAAYEGNKDFISSPSVPQREGRPPRGLAGRKSETEQIDLLLPRSILMDKEIITRTSGKKLGYINEVFVDPKRLEVVTLYLRQSVSSLGAASVEHVSLSSLKQIGDVVLVHDESALWDPPGDESMGYVQMIGSEVQTEDGFSLGKIRDFLFNPDNGQILSIRFDALGIPSIPQNLLTCSRLSWRDIVAVGPTKTIVRRGADRRVIKENEGWLSEYIVPLISAISGMDLEETEITDTREKYRADPAYAAWYEKHAMEYEQYYNQKLPKPISPSRPRGPSRETRRKVVDRRKPLALPPPQRIPIEKALKREQPLYSKSQGKVRQFQGDNGLRSKERKSTLEKRNINQDSVSFEGRSSSMEIQNNFMDKTRAR